MPLLHARSGPSYGALDRGEQHGDDERDRLLHEEAEVGSSGIETPDEIQDGVRKIEAINLTWTTRSLVIAYVRSVCGLLPRWSSDADSGEAYFLWHSARLSKARHLCHYRHMRPVRSVNIP